MTGHLLDTHYWLWFQSGDESQLSAEARDELLALQRTSALYLSDISILEVACLVAEERIDLGTSVDRFVDNASRAGGFQLLPLTRRILIESTRLPGDIHRDPADRLLVATAREHGLTLVTRDKLLLQYAKQGHVNVRKP